MSIDRGIFVIGSAASEAQKEQALHTNNMANISTPGFKKAFIAQRALPAYESGDPTRVYSTTYSPGHDYTMGNIKETNNNLHVYLEGEGGFFAVLGKDGTEGYTRRGDLKINNDGQLLNGNDQLVIGTGGPIVLPPCKNVNISVNGEVSVTPLNATSESMVVVDKLKLVKPNPKLLQQSPDGLFRLSHGAVAGNDETLRVKSGGYEDSNVNVIESLMAIMESVHRQNMVLQVASAVKDNAQSSSGLLSIP